MSEPIISLHHWFKTPPGRYLLAWERERYDQAVGDLFGYHGLQLGLPGFDALAANRMPHRWLAVAHPADANLAWRDGAPLLPELDADQPRPKPVLVADGAALPFQAGSIDLVVLPHTLELSADPHGTLREVERVLVPEGRVIVSCLNPASLWGLRQRRARITRRLGWGEPFLPEAGEFIGYWRLRDWLRLLDLEVESSHFGCYRPAVHSEAWLRRFAWMDAVGDRSWNIFGAAYFVVAAKRVRGVRLLDTSWKKPKASVAAPVPAVQHGGPHRDSQCRATVPARPVGQP